MTTSTAPKLAELTGEYKLDASHSRIGFVARHAMVTKVRGAFNDFEGEGYLDGGNLANSNVKVTIKTESIDTRNGQRDGHLRTNDFLDVPNHPEITFVSTAVRELDESNFELTGDLKIKDVTKSITIPLEYQGAATDPFGAQRIGFEGSVNISRAEYGITWNAALETGGVLVSDKIVLEFEISAVKQA